MSVLVTRKKYAAMISIERDKYLLSDGARRDRALNAEPSSDRSALKKVWNSRKWREFLDKNAP